MKVRFFFTGFIAIATANAAFAAETPVLSASAPAFSAPHTLPGAECAQRMLLLAAKKNVARQFDNSPNSHGQCAFGVRTSLQASKVGGVNGSLGNAVDFLRTLKPHGFVDNGNRDPNKAPPGSVLILVGKRTATYFRSGGFGRPAGDWLGHVTIKGDDGRYYTDGRTREPALGWEDGVNKAKRRNMAATFVPTAALAAQYVGRCAKIYAKEQVVDMTLAASEARLLSPEDPAAREAGHRLVQEGQQILARGDSAAAFQQALRLARESSPFDDEGEFVNALARRVIARPALRAELDGFLTAQSSQDATETCKTRVFASSIRNAICHGDNGQDSSAACPQLESFQSCMLQ